MRGSIAVGWAPDRGTSGASEYAPPPAMQDTESLRKLLKSNLSIPTLPDVVLRIERLANDPLTGTAEIGAVVAEDAPLAAKVLRIANSAFYGLAQPVASTEQASTVLGLRVLKNLVTQVSILAEFEKIQAETGFDISELWDHSKLTAQLASRMTPLCTKIMVLNPDEAYVCGLLHKVGQVILLDHLGTPYANVLKKSMQLEGDAYLIGMERKMLGFHHQDVGATLAKRWNLPASVVSAIQLCGTPVDQLGPSLHVHLITVASRAAKQYLNGDVFAANETLQQSAIPLGLDPVKSVSLFDQIDPEEA